MCETCGCEDAVHVTATNLQTGRHIDIEGGGRQSSAGGRTAHGRPHVHVRADGTRYVHTHDEPHLHHTHGAASPGPVVEIERRILAKNDALAARNRAQLAEQRVFALNMMGAPGAGKTALLERTIRRLGLAVRISVIEGDQATLNDSERIRAAGAPVVQVNTGTGCHLDADMVAHAIRELDLPSGGVVIIENVGNLVCPALFDVGERRRAVVFSVTEGEDKPLKYPHMFRSADVVLLNKIDLVPHLDFDTARAVANTRLVNPGVNVMCVSARTGEGLEEWCRWLEREAGSTEPAHSR